MSLYDTVSLSLISVVTIFVLGAGAGFVTGIVYCITDDYFDRRPRRPRR